MKNDMHANIIFFVLNTVSGCQWMVFPFLPAMLNQLEGYTFLNGCGTIVANWQAYYFMFLHQDP